MWRAERCDLCGDCLVKCRYANYEREKAIVEMRLLKEGKEAEILEKCITCLACNDYCPTGAEPADLITRLQEKFGTSPVVKTGMFALDEIIKGLEGKGDPREVIEGEPDKPILSLDSFRFQQFPPGTFESELFRGLTIVRGGEFMSLAGCVHMGGASLVEKYGQKVLDRWAAFGKEIVYMHNEGFILAHVKAKEFGFRVNFKYMHLFEYLSRYLKDNRDRVQKLGKKVAYQANCATRWIPEYDRFLGEIFELIGVDRPGRRFEGINALCCSAPVIFANKELALEIQRENLEDAIASGAEAIITSCPICNWVLSRPSAKYGLPKIFITDLVRMALGEISWPAPERRDEK